LKVDENRFVSRRWFCYLPGWGEPVTCRSFLE